MPLWWRPACACNDGGPSEYCLVTGPSPVPDYNMIPTKTGDSFIYPDSATAGIISGKLAVDWREAFQTHRVPSWFLVCSTIYIIRVYISTYLQSADIYTYLQAVDISTMECVSAITRGSGGWAAAGGVTRCPTARPASHAALPWSALEWLNYSTKYFFGGGFVSTQKIIVQIPQPLPVRLTKKIK